VTLSAAETEEPGDILFIRYGGSQRMAFDRLKTVATANRAALGKTVLLVIGTPTRQLFDCTRVRQVTGDKMSKGTS